jgi:hypothetical protein
MTALVEALHAVIAARSGQTADADFKEADHPRGKGGQWTAGQHEKKAGQHSDQAVEAKSQPGNGAQLHSEAAKAHMLAAHHLQSQTGWAEHHAAAAHAATAKASQAAGPASMGELKATASNPKASLEQRAAAVTQLQQMEKAGNTVASSPFAKVAPLPVPKEQGSLTGSKPSPWPKGQPHAGPLHPEMQSAANAAVNQPDVPARDPKSIIPAAEGALGPKPTSATAKGIKASTHELLSSGHPFSIDELMKATGVTNPKMMVAYLGDLKNPKYAGKLHLQIEKRPADGMYHVKKSDTAASTAPAADPKTAPAPSPTAPGKQHSLATIAQSLINKGTVKPGPTTPVPGTAPKLTSAGLKSSKSEFSTSAALDELSAKGVDYSHIKGHPLHIQIKMLKELVDKHKDTPHTHTYVTPMSAHGDAKGTYHLKGKK